MLAAILTFALGLISGNFLNRSSHHYGRLLDARASLVGAYRRAYEHLVDYRHAGLDPDVGAVDADPSLGLVRSALLEFDVHAATLEMLEGPLGLDETRRELTDCMSRIHGLVRHFDEPGNEARLEAFADSDVAVEIDNRLRRVVRRYDILVARYRRYRLADAVRVWKARRRAAEAADTLGQPPRHGYKVDNPELGSLS